MNESFSLRPLGIAVGLSAALLATGCFDTRQEFTLNPDGSGKVTHECSFQQFNLFGEEDPSEEALKEAIRSVLRESKGIEAWRDVTYQRLADGRIHFKGTAYFTNLSHLEIPNQTLLEFGWEPSGQEAVLQLRTDSAEEESAGQSSANALPAEERQRRIDDERARFQQAKSLMTGVVEGMKHEVTFRLPGAAHNLAGFRTDTDSGTLVLRLSGAQLMEAMETLVNDDEWMDGHVGTFGSQQKPAMDEQVTTLLFGAEGPVHARVGPAMQPLFEYAQEVAAAAAETAALRETLGMGSVTITIAPPAEGQPLEGVKIVGVRVVSTTDYDDVEFRPFNYDPGYTVVLQVDFPGSILDLTDESTLLSAVADDGTSLLPSNTWDRTIRFPTLSKDRTSALIELNLELPGPTVNGLSELTGRLEYQVATTTREIELGFTELAVGARGKELGAQIQSLQEGWNDDGSQLVELQLNLPESTLKSLSLVRNGTKTELERRGYFGGGDTYTFTFEHKTALPADGELVVEIYDQLKTYVAPFSLQNISLLGRSKGTN